jgi:4-phytase/acid phosphatase
LADLPSELTVGDEGSRIRLSGPIGIGSMASEVFLLQYAQGFPASEVGWGRAATPQAIQPLMRLHVLRFDLVDRTPYLAARQGSPAVDRIVGALRRAAEAPASAPKMTLIVGHDDNIANIGGMLGLHWLLPSYLMDQTPPAGALHFELLRENGRGALAVRVSYVAQSLDQMRNATPLSLAHPPERAVAAFERCRIGRDRACPWPRFVRLANQAIDRACVPASPQ